jgi:hypothetical protein
MSWGERSCVKPCRCPDACEMSTCNVDCSGYRWDGVTPPDSKHRPPKQVEERVTSYNKPMAAQGLNRAQRRAQAKKSARLRNW